MVIRVVRLGTARSAAEGLRIGTVRRPPRGVPKARFAVDDWYDLWYPVLAPSPATVRLGQGASSEADRQRFRKVYRKEMAEPAAAQSIALLAALSRQTDFAVGCYCEDEARCHRSVLRELLEAAGAALA